jgi:hypothetical protein
MNQIRTSYKRDEILKEGHEIISSKYMHVQVKKGAKVNGTVKELYAHPDIVKISRALELANDVYRERTEDMNKQEVRALVQNLVNEFFYQREMKK